MAYYAPGLGNIQDNMSIAKFEAPTPPATTPEAAINSRFKGMNVLTTLDDLPMTGGFEAYTSYALTGYKWGGTQIYYVALSSLKRNIKNCSSVSTASTSGKTYSNASQIPKVYYVMFQAAGGAGGTDNNTGCGGGSGYYTLSRVVLQPASSFKVTHSTTQATINLVTGAAYMDGAIRTAGYSFSITASAGTAGGANNAGGGFRSGGEEERGGASIAVDWLSYDGYTFPAYAILGGLAGQDRVGYGYAIESGRGGGGGGASAGPYLRNYGGAQRTGGGGAFYYKDPYNTYSHPAIAGIYGGGGGGSEGPLRGAAGGEACSLVFS